MRSFQTMERNYGLEGESLEEYSPKEFDQHWKTYEQWKAEGHPVQKGEKSTRINGIPAFHILQTKR